MSSPGSSFPQAGTEVSIFDMVLIADWLPPEFGAIGQYAMQFGEAAAERGARVGLVGFTTGATSRDKRSIGAGSIEVVRLSRRSYDKSRLVRRAWWTLTANLQLIRGAWPMLRSAKEIVFTGSPPYFLHFISPIKWLLDARLRYRIADFHPECLIAASGRPSRMLRAIEHLTWFWRRRVDVVEIIAEDQRARLLRNGVMPERIELRRDRSPVSFLDAEPTPVPPTLEGKFVILYSGNWGVAHDADTFLGGLASLPPEIRQRIGVWLNATGARISEVMDGAARLGVATALTPPCPLTDLPGVLLAADLHLITLSDAFVGLVLPSKVYACIDSGRPILFVGSACSDVHLLASQSRGETTYRRASNGNPEEVAEAITSLLVNQ